MRHARLVIGGTIAALVIAGGVTAWNVVPAIRTIRLNNPGAIKKSANAWRGKVETSDPTFEAFDTPLNGARAMLINMRTHYARGDVTVGKMVAGWSATDVASYSARVARLTFGDAAYVNNRFDWTKATATKMAWAMAQVEAGVPWFGMDLFAQAWDAM